MFLNVGLLKDIHTQQCTKIVLIDVFEKDGVIFKTLYILPRVSILRIAEPAYLQKCRLISCRAPLELKSVPIVSVLLQNSDFERTDLYKNKTNSDRIIPLKFKTISA